MHTCFKLFKSVISFIYSLLFYTLKVKIYFVFCLVFDGYSICWKHRVLN